jgi:hypothetical protein
VASKDLIFTVLGIDRASRVFRDVGESMDSMGQRAIRILGGVTAASAGSALAVGAALGAIPVAFAGLGAIALRESTIVRRTFEDLSETLNEGLAADAEPLADALTGAARKIGAAYQDLRPQLADAFAASAPHVDTLIDGVLDFARNAVPGMVTAVRRADPVMLGFRALMRDAGVGVGEFFDIISQRAPEAGRGIEHLGTLVRGALPQIGGIIGDLTGLWAQHGAQVVDVVLRILGVIGQLSGSALPVTAAALGTVLDVLSGVLSVIEPMTGALGPLIGAWLGLATAMRGIRAVQGVVDSVSASFSTFSANAEKAAGSKGVGKFTAAVGGIMSQLGGPWGIAIALGAAALSLFGQRSEEAASTQRSLTSALRESGGAFDTTARKALAQSDSYKAIADSVTKAGISHAEFIDALIRGGAPLDALKAKLEAAKRAGEEHSTESGELVVTYTAQAEAAADVLRATDSLRASVQDATADFERERQAVAGAQGSMEAAKPGADELREAMKTLGNATATTAEHADALNTAWRTLFGLQISLEEATAGWEEGLDTLRETMEAARREGSTWQTQLISTQGQLNLTTEHGRALQRNLVEQGEQYRTLAQTAYDTALRQTGSQQMARDAAVKASEERRAQFLAEMRQMGLTQTQAEILAARYLGMPDDVLTLIRAKDEATKVVDKIIRDNSGRQIGLRVVTQHGPGVLIGGRVPAVRDGGLIAFANGGQVPKFPHGGMVRGPGGPRSDSILAAVSNGEYVVNAAATKRNLALLEAINRGENVTSRMAAASPSRTYNLTVYTTTSAVDVATQFRRMELLDGG